MKPIIESLLALFGIARTAKVEQEVQNIDSGGLQKGPHQRENLSIEQLERLDRIRETLADVDDQSREEWIDNFKRDLNPDTEIAIWEHLAKSFQSYCSRNDLTKEARAEVLPILLLRSTSMTEDEILASVDLNHLTEEQIREIISLY